MKRNFIILILLLLCVIPAVSATYPFTVWGLPNDTTSTFPALSTADVNAMCLDVLGGNAVMSGDYPTSQVVKKSQSCDDVNAGGCTVGLANIGIGNNITIYPTSSASNWTVFAMCKRTSPPLGNLGVRYSFYLNASPPLPTANFVGSPLIGSAPQLITLNDTSTGGIATSWNWTGSGPGPLLWGNLTTRDTSVYLPNDGNYTITHCVANNAGSDCETKNDYISLYNASNSTVTTQFIIIDAVSGYSISNASVSLKDIQNNSWTNTTSTTSMGKALITTLIGHTINAYASAAGFKDNDLLGVPAIAAPGGHIILLNPTGYYNVSPGWVTLHVKVQDESTSNPISGASVSVGKSNGMAELWQTTNAAGIATFPVENKTDFVVRASAAGYVAASKGVNSGTGNGGDATVPVNIFLSKATVSPTVTMTAGPGGTVPVTQDPYLSLSSEEKQSALATDVMNYGPMLVNFFILLTIVGGFKMITK